MRNITTSRNLDLIPLLRPASSGTKTNGSLSSTFHHPLLHVHHHQKACCFASTCHLRTLQQPHHHHPQAQVVLVEIPQSWIILEIDSSSDTVVQQVAERLNHIEDFSFSRKLYLKMSMFRTSLLSERNQSTFCYSSKCSYQGKTACRSGHVQCSWKRSIPCRKLDVTYFSQSGIFRSHLILSLAQTTTTTLPLMVPLIKG